MFKTAGCGDLHKSQRCSRSEQIRLPRKIGLEKIDTKYENKHVRQYENPMKEDTRKLLIDLYKSYNERLFEFLGYRISEWDIQ